MATEGQGLGGSSKGFDIAESVRKIAAKNARASLMDDDQLVLFLQSWWSRTYNRPLKDPLLQTYTLEELLYEFYDKVERVAAEEERLKRLELQEEEDKEQDVLDWTYEEERKEAENAAKAAAAAVMNHEEPPASDPTKDPNNIKWMEEQLRLAKAELGDDFGEDLELNFDDK